MSFELDAAFERALIESARNDAQPGDVQRAWTRFAGALALVVPDGVSPSRVTAADRPAPLTAAPSTLGARAAWGWGLKWFLLGTIGSGAFGAGLLVERYVAHRGLARSAVPPRVDAPAGLEPSPSSARRAEARGVPAAPAAIDEEQSLGHHPHPPHSRARGVPPPRLADEVARIDTARTASAMGDYDEAMRLIERYHHDFPEGLLAPDADVVALEAAAAKRDQAEVARRSALFLARYPDDPHSARVRRLSTEIGGAP